MASWSADDLDRRARDIESLPFVCCDEEHGPLPRQFVATGAHCRCPLCGSKNVAEDKAD